MIHETVHAAHALAFPMESTGIFDLVDSLGAKTLATIRIIAGVVCTAVFLWLCAKGRWTFPAIIGSLMLTSLAFWGVYHITDVKDRVDREVNKAMAPHSAPSTTVAAASRTPGTAQVPA